MKLILLTLIALLAVTASSSAQSPLIHQADLEYLGGFRLPEVDGRTVRGMDYSQKGLAFRPPSPGAPFGSLITSGNYSSVAEIAIPDPATFSKDSYYKNLPRSPLLMQAPTSPFNPTVLIVDNEPCDKNVRSGGFLVKGDNILATLYHAYECADSQVRSTYKNSVTTLSGATAVGSYLPNDKTGTFTGTPLARFIAGYMTHIPTEYQTLLDGDVLSGLQAPSIVTKTSYGPAAFSFWAEDIINNSDIETPFDVTPLMYVAGGESHPLYGYWEGNAPANDVLTASDDMGGVVFPDGTRSVIYFANHGTGEQCYGEGTSNILLHKTIIPGGTEIYCYDPSSSSKGQHSYPYVYRAWAFDADDLVKVKNGTLAHNEVIPYAYWNIDFPQLPEGDRLYNIQGAAYDNVNKIIYVTQYKAEETYPLYQAFRVNIGGSAKHHWRMGGSIINSVTNE